MVDVDYDLCVIGGGINGVGIARDAAGRGLSVLLVEAKDLAQGTSSASTKLIHGGLRYLEFLEFKLVRDSLIEREKILRIAPHIVRPMEFVYPLVKGGRPFWMVRLGLFLYDHLARRRRIPKSYSVDLSEDYSLKDDLDRGFIYSDCWADDSRLVVLNAMDAAERGADILTHTRCSGLQEKDGKWCVSLEQKSKGARQIIASRVVNAAGPWVGEVLKQSGLDEFSPRMRLVKGSHIIIPRSFEGERSYILPQKDGRVVFAIPYEDQYTLIGTTEEGVEGDLYDVQISNKEISYLCTAYNAFFIKQIKHSDVVWAYSGVRPLCDDGEAVARKVSRDYVLYEHLETSAPMISVFGGKLTTYRVLAEKVVNKLLYLDNGYSNPWTDEQPLPGGDFDDDHFAVFFAEMKRSYAWLPEAVLYRYARLYGTRLEVFLDGAKSTKDLGQDFGCGLYEAELAYLVRYEFAKNLEDALFRRTKLGLHISESAYKALEKAWPKIVKRALA